MSISDLSASLNKYQTIELTRLTREVVFIDKIETDLDLVLDEVAEGLYQDMVPAIDAVTTAEEDKGFVKSLISGSVDKLSDPSLVNGVSDVVNRGTADTVGKAIGSYDASNVIGSIANRAVTTDDRLVSQVPTGSLASADEVTPDIYDPSKKIQNKVFNTLGAKIQYDPGSIPQFAQIALDKFIEANDQLVVDLDHLNDLLQGVSDNCVAIDSSYYTIDQFDKAEDGKEKLLLADTNLVRVRSELIHTESFNQNTYSLARGHIEDAAAIFADNGSTSNLIVEITGLMNAIDFLLVSIENQYNVMYAQWNNMIDYMDDYISKMKFNGPMLAIANMIQAEIRSIIRSIEAVVARRQPAILPEHMRRWWMQSLSLAEQMVISPSGVEDYFLSDPDGYIAAYTPISVGLNAIPMGPNLDTLHSQWTQLRFLVSKKLEVNVPASSIVALVNQMIADNDVRITNIDQASTVAGLYNIPVDDGVKLVTQILVEAGMDRAAEAIYRGDNDILYSMSGEDASSIGKFDLDVSRAIEDYQTQPNANYDTLAALQEAHRYVRNQKRSRDLLSSTMHKFKEDAKEQTVKKDIPEAQRVLALVARYNEGIA